jgi:hypothetical protein
MQMVINQEFGPGFWNVKRARGFTRISFKSDPVAPAAPDPTTTAAAQTASNIATANAQANLNHTNQYTPWGSQVYSSTPNADGTSSWSSNITLSPAQQQLLDAQNGQSLALSSLGTSQLQNVTNSLGTPVNLNNATAVKNDPLTSKVATGAIQSSIAPSGNIQTQVDTSGVPSLVGGDALETANQQAQQAAYAQQTATLDPQFSQQQHDLENQLVQQGVTQNSAAWNQAMNNLNTQKTSAYSNAFNNSFATGLSADNQIYNQGLSSNQNAYSQALSNGNFANSAQSQQFGQNAAQEALANSAQNQTFSQGLANADLNNQVAGQDYTQSSAERAAQQNQMVQQQQIPLNLLNALRSGSQVTSPTFGSTPQTSVGGTDISSLNNNAYQGQLAAYNGQVASNNSTTSAVAGLGSAALMAFAF